MQCWHVTGFYTDNDGVVSVDHYVLSPDHWGKGDVLAHQLAHASPGERPRMAELVDNARVERVAHQMRDGRLMVAVAEQVTDYVFAQGTLLVGVADQADVSVLAADGEVS